MKHFIFLSIVAASLLACNNEGAKNESTTDSTTTTANSEGTADNANVGRDSINSSNTVTTKADPASEEFLKKAAEGGMVEVDAGKMAQEKAMNSSVKEFASMMVSDHSGANSEVKSLASRKSVTLPAAPSESKKQECSKIGEKKGKDFDKAYMDMMVKDHKSTIALFESAQKDSKDDDVKSFVVNTLPKLKVHLDSAVAISKRIK
jgi:putative membrane protein